MNADISSVNTTKHKKLKDKSNVRIYKHNNSNDHKVIYNASDTKQAIDNLGQCIEHKQKDSNSMQMSYTSSSPTKNIHSTATGKRQTYKLVDSKQTSKPLQQSDKRTFFLDTYAHIAATNNRRCSKRLHELATPRRRVRNNDQNDSPTNLNLNYWQMIKTYSAKTRCSSENSQKK